VKGIDKVFAKLFARKPDPNIGAAKLRPSSGDHHLERSPADTAFKQGDIIRGEYQICKILGAGGFGEVYLAYHNPTEAFLALKTIRSDKFDDDVLYEAFKKEALLWVHLEQHPFILAAQGIEQLSGRLFVIMEYVAPDARGRVSLLDHLAQAHGPLDTDRALLWAIQFCFGMEHAHRRGITCHRDIKPANILITQYGVLKITDFGLAVAADMAWKDNDGSFVITKEKGSFGLSVTHVEGRRICGTPGYIAPELLLGKKADNRSDVYSFGLVVWQMAAGSPLPPFHVPRERDIERYLREVFRQQMTGRVSAVGQPFDSIIARCLAPEPSARYENFADLRGDLERIYLRRTGRVVELPKTQEQNEYFWNNKGNSLLSLNRDEEALACYEKALQINPRDALSWSNKANALLSLGRPADAIVCSAKALEINPHDAWAWRTMGNARLEQGRRERIMACGKALEIDPQSPSDWNSKGNAKIVMGSPKEAIVCFEKALEINPRDPVAWTGKGNALHTLGRADESIVCYDRALEIDPAYALAWNDKANALVALGRSREEVRACSDKAAALNPRYSAVDNADNSKSSALFALGLLQEAAGRRITGNALLALHLLGEALACYEKAAEIEPQDLFALSSKGKVLDELGWTQDAIACYEKTLEIDPRYSAGWMYKGDTLNEAGRLEEAVACYDKALEINPRDAWAWARKADALLQLHRLEEAVACWKKEEALGGIKFPGVPQNRE